MRTNKFHAENATDAQILNEYERIKIKTSTLSSTLRSLVKERAEKILQK